jgi:hypothetical protein
VKNKKIHILKITQNISEELSKLTSALAAVDKEIATINVSGNYVIITISESVTKEKKLLLD